VVCADDVSVAVHARQVTAIFAGIQNEMFLSPTKKMDARALTTFRVRGAAAAAAANKAKESASATSSSTSGSGSNSASAAAAGDATDPVTSYPEAELNYSEFVEALCAIALFRHPNPYQPLHETLRLFLEEELLPWIKKQQQNW
jgi:hypothetical protein